jgi:methylamine dehydrogenase accessory protein MauD
MVEVLVVSQAVLLLVVLALAVVVFALARQIGVLHERVAPLGALMTDHAVDVGQAAPVLEVADLAGDKLRLGGARADGRSQLLLFVSPTCPMCKKLLAVAKSFVKSERSHLWLALVGDGERSEQEKFVRDQKLQALPYVVSPVVGMTYQVGKLPYAVLIDEAGVVRAKGLVNSREHLESLLVAKETGYASIQQYLDARLAPVAEAEREKAVAAMQGVR